MIDFIFCNKYEVVVKRKAVVGYDSRSSRLEVVCYNGVLANFVKLTGKHLC